MREEEERPRVECIGTNSNWLLSIYVRLLFLSLSAFPAISYISSFPLCSLLVYELQWICGNISHFSSSSLGSLPHTPHISPKVELFSSVFPGAKSFLFREHSYFRLATDRGIHADQYRKTWDKVSLLAASVSSLVFSSRRQRSRRRSERLGKEHYLFPKLLSHLTLSEIPAEQSENLGELSESHILDAFLRTNFCSL